MSEPEAGLRYFPVHPACRVALLTVDGEPRRYGVQLLVEGEWVPACGQDVSVEPPGSAERFAMLLVAVHGADGERCDWCSGCNDELADATIARLEAELAAVSAENTTNARALKAILAEHDRFVERLMGLLGDRPDGGRGGVWYLVDAVCELLGYDPEGLRMTGHSRWVVAENAPPGRTSPPPGGTLERVAAMRVGDAFARLSDAGTVEAVRQMPPLAAFRLAAAIDVVCPGSAWRTRPGDPAPIGHMLAATVDWAKTNKRRGELIMLEIAEDLSPSEDVELEWLQRIADLRTDLLDPFDDLPPDAVE